MPRVGRVVLPGYPHHIVQRGHNRQVIFAQDEDIIGYLENLQELKLTFGIGIYAYCLMTNHVHRKDVTRNRHSPRAPCGAIS